MAKSNSWKTLEKAFRDLLIKHGIDAWRKARGMDWSQKVDDIGIYGMDWFVSDCKYSIHGFVNNQQLSKVSRLLKETEEKYCPTKEHRAVLVTRGYKETPMVVSCDGEFFAELLAFYLKHNQSPETQDGQH